MDLTVAPAQSRSSVPSRRITERDRMLLGFAAEQRLVLAEHVQALLGVTRGTAQTRLRAMAAHGLLERATLFDRRPGCYRITRAGLGLSGSSLPPPRIDLRSYEHDVGLAWLALAARRGCFGQVREVLSERELRSKDTLVGEGKRHQLAVRLGGYGPGGRERLHYPDLLLQTQSGHRVAVELELSGKGRARRERILAGYAADPRIDAVLYLVRDRRLAGRLEASARKLGISRMVHVQPVRFRPPGAAPGGAAAARGTMRSTERPGAGR